MNILISPIVTEKSMTNAASSKYSFKVERNADKISIKKAIEEKFKVNVLKVSTVNIKKIKTRSGARRIQKLDVSFKKATVTLKPGQKISVFDSGSSK